MCLDVVKKRVGLRGMKVTDDVVPAWKAFSIKKLTIMQQGKRLKSDVFVPGKWINANSIRNIDSCHGYELGFHAWKTKEAASAWSSYIVPVLLRKVVATGIQNGHEAIVARELMVFPGFDVAQSHEAYDPFTAK